MHRGEFLKSTVGVVGMTVVGLAFNPAEEKAAKLMG